MNRIFAWLALLKTTTAFASFVLALSCASATYADSFGSGAFNIEFVTIGNPGNSADASVAIPSPAGSVATEYRIGKYETSEQMINTANTLGGLGITKDGRGPDKPATSISWNEAARFVNWLNTSSGSTPAYKFDFQPGQGGYSANANIQLWSPGDPGYNPNNLYRNSLARYFLPSVGEWHKAAFYNPNSGVYYDYPTGSDSVPDGIDVPNDSVFQAVFNDGIPNTDPNDITNVGVLSPYGTAGQGGNVYEWDETSDPVNSPGSFPRGLRGGYWQGGFGNLHATIRSAVSPTIESNQFGFRVASASSVAGDFDDNGVVNSLDIDILWHIVRGTGTDPGNNDTADLNGDGVANEDDVDLELASKLTAGPGRHYGDADLVGGVGPDDFTAWRIGGTGWAHGDFDGTGDVGPDDFTLWRTAPTTYPSNVGPRPGDALAAVPEPTTLALAALGIVAGLLMGRTRVK